MKCIAILMAMEAEANGLVTRLHMTEVPGVPPLPCRIFETSSQGCRIIVAVNGMDSRHGVDSIGTEAAALTTYVIAHRFQPELVISAGTAGGWQRCGAEIGDVYISDRHFVHHDRRVGLAGFAEYGVGSYPAVPATGLARMLNLKLGMVTTSNSLDENADDRTMIARSGACVKDMEAAAVAYVCEIFAVPVMAVKAITDLVDHHTATADQFSANLAMAVNRLTDAMEQIIDFCGARTLKDLA